MGLKSPEHITDYMMDSNEEDEDEMLQELFLAGKLKPGLNIPVEKKIFVNDVEKLKSKLNSIKTDLPWMERFDIINEQAELAPELSVELKEQEEFVKTGRSDNLALNEFKRETMFHRQAQLAAMEGLARVKAQGIPTIRPNDYFAEMMKTDEHMQKVRHSLLEKQAGLERSEKVKKMRTERKLAKKKQVESTLRKQKDKRELMENIKKYRKGMRTDLDFLENKSQQDNPSRKVNKKRQMKNEKFGFGGKKGKFKNNNIDSKPKNKRPGKSRRNKMKKK
ncbi:probable rRNA-processing protein EBP2 homolog [Planococcus citri]|uniref:probable rRNA-processing protein EBP2 homolog n=1 Tax=Planococcus citri TaxID=170843 RepID=UPI0031F98C93